MIGTGRQWSLKDYPDRFPETGPGKHTHLKKKGDHDRFFSPHFRENAPKPTEAPDDPPEKYPTE
jgi:hypothetical protein